MNKRQLDYLISKISVASATAIKEYAKDKPVEHDKEVIAQELAKAGFIPNPSYGYKQTDLKYAASYLSLPPVKEFEENKAKIEAYKSKVDVAKQAAIDAAYLGDNKDAMNILASFAEQLKTI